MFVSVELPIARMLADHDDAGVLLAKMRDCPAAIARLMEAAPAISGSIWPWKNSNAIFIITSIWKATSGFRVQWRWNIARGDGACLPLIFRG